MAVKFQLRRDVAANWTATNPILSEGEPGVETDTLKFKLGNGVTAWTLLDYAGGESDFNELINKPTTLSGYGIIDAVQPGDLAAIATSGSYNDLTDTPTIPADVGDLTDTTNLFFDRSYNSLTDTPTIPADVGDLTDTGNLLSGGDLVGPSSATDNAITRFDSTTGKLVQNSLVTVADNGAIIAPSVGSVIPFYFADQASFPNASTYHGAVAHSHNDGKMYFAHGGVWNALANANDLVTEADTLATVTGRGATTATNISTTGFLQSSRAVVAPNKITYKGPGTLAGLALPTIFTSGQSPYGIAVDPSGRFVYAVHVSNSTIGKYLINQTTGNADSYPTFYATGATPAEVAVDPSGRFLYVTNRGAATVSQYSINQTTGVLTSITTAIVSGTSPQGIAVDPTGRFVYVTCWGNNSISQYSINQTTGALTQITTAIATGTTPWGVAVDPTGRFVYVTINGAGTISQYSINQTTGALTQITTAVAAGSSPRGITADPTGRFVYVACIEPGLFLGAVKQYSINQTTGALTEIVTAIEAGAEPYGIAVDPTGRFVYTVSQNSGSVSQYSINQTTGALTSVTTAIATGSNPHEIAIDPTGRFVYVTNQSSNTISQFSIDNFSVGSISVSGSLTVAGITTFQSTVQYISVINTKTGATGTVAHDFATGSLFLHSSIAANFTANFTNIPTTSNRAITLALILDQGATAYIPNAVQIDGVAQTIQWSGGFVPSGTSNYTDIVNFTLIRLPASAWMVLGSLSTYN